MGLNLECWDHCRTSWLPFLWISKWKSLTTCQFMEPTAWSIKPIITWSNDSADHFPPFPEMVSFSLQAQQFALHQTCRYRSQDRHLSPEIDRSSSEIRDEAWIKCGCFMWLEWTLSASAKSRYGRDISLYSFTRPHVATLQRKLRADTRGPSCRHTYAGRYLA